MRQLKSDFLSRLSPWYDAREIISLLEWCVCHALGWGRTQWFLAQQDSLSDEHRQRVVPYLERLVDGEPIQYILGEALFCGMTFVVTPSVLIPRPETEELVHLIVAQNKGRKIKILDVGTGSGVIAITLSLLLPDAEIEAWDVSLEALQVAERNNELLGGRVLFRHVDVLDDRMVDSVASIYDIIVSNPPYITQSEQSEMKRHVMDHEPHLALFVEDSDPLLFYRKIGSLGRRLLYPQGKIYFEINEQYGLDTLGLLESQGYRSAVLRTDLSGRPRMVSASNE